jgi:Holliday junction DNA helicase RuvA
MIARLTGMVVDVGFTHIVLDVAGVGYRIAVRSPSRFKVDAVAALHTHLAVRENALDLYGFENRDELEMFEQLLRLPKIGPKSAMQVLVQADIDLLKKSVAANDPTYLSKMSGIGKKSAEKIVLGLKDVFEYEEGDARATLSQNDLDAMDALMALGYSQRDAREALQRLSPEVTLTNDRIKEALKTLGS